ncbi:GntR family transcriptional regulator [Agromyces aerolatus]|uniref:GntR family transcriptional regulator n=1 Tax=Agromyces sp. LY-1074 TaxID=3074080 RepID=UPI002861EA94|nr:MULTISPECIES: GntR family transcriptional regulator [unclassified Agromyces]MDR5701563.1 GntR family transcriptional regulator [Agromyces sp. LY-1074]MDR5707830.1 GntR family transcriptional regulator [Agromyces sp. LY-1358]
MSLPSGVSPLQPTMSLRERVEMALEAAICSGEMPPGELFSAPGLAARFNVSATPVREAMLNLEKRGFVEAVRNKGFRVTTVRDEDLENIVAVRRLLEPPVMRWLVGAIPPEAFAELRAMAGTIVDGAAQGDLTTYLEADRAFHAALTSFTGNARLTSLVSDLRQETRLPGLAGLLATEELTKSAAEHDEILDLLEAGDGAGAEALMHRHIGHIIGWWAGRSEA